MLSYVYSKSVTSRFEGGICSGDVVLGANVLEGLVSVLVFAKVVMKFLLR